MDRETYEAVLACARSYAEAYADLQYYELSGPLSLLTDARQRAEEAYVRLKAMLGTQLTDSSD